MGPKVSPFLPILPSLQPCANHRSSRNEVRLMKKHLYVAANVLLSFIVLWACSAAAAEQTSELASDKVSGPSRANPAVPKDYVQVVPYWMTEASWRSELQLKNNQFDRELTVTPILRTPNGAEMNLPNVT